MIAYLIGRTGRASGAGKTYTFDRALKGVRCASPRRVFDLGCALAAFQA